MAQPYLIPGEPAYGPAYTQVMGDEFNGTVISPRWRPETLRADAIGRYDQAAQHAVGQYGQDRDGNVGQGLYAWGKRWAGWYDDHRDAVQYVQNGKLILKGLATDEIDPTVSGPYYDPGELVTVDPTKKLYSSWLDGFAIRYFDGDQRPAPDAPNQWLRYGYIETKIDFSKMKVPGFRVSFWLLPTVRPTDILRALVGTTYNGIPSDGLEHDLFEYEPGSGQASNLLLMKNIWGDGPTDAPINATDFNIDLTAGPVIIGVYWTQNRMGWYVNGREVNYDQNAVMQVPAHLCLTREMNTGVFNPGEKPENTHPLSDPPKRQRDPGLYLRNIYAFKDLIEDDAAEIHYVRAWQDPLNLQNMLSPDIIAPDTPDPSDVHVYSPTNGTGIGPAQNEDPDPDPDPGPGPGPGTTPAPGTSQYTGSRGGQILGPGLTMSYRQQGTKVDSAPLLYPKAEQTQNKIIDPFVARVMVIDDNDAIYFPDTGD